MVETRCFLFLVNYSRMKPEIAVKAIPVLEQVGWRKEWAKDVNRNGTDEFLRICTIRTH